MHFSKILQMAEPGRQSRRCYDAGSAVLDAAATIWLGMANLQREDGRLSLGGKALTTETRFFASSLERE